MPSACANWRAVVLEHRPWVQALIAVSALTSASVLRRMRVQPRRSRARVNRSAKCLGSVGLAGVGRHGTMSVKNAPLPLRIKALSCTRYCALAAMQHDLDIQVGAVGHGDEGGERDVAALEEISQRAGAPDDHGPLEGLVSDGELEAGGECGLEGVPALFARHWSPPSLTDFSASPWMASFNARRLSERLTPKTTSTSCDLTCIPFSTA